MTDEVINGNLSDYPSGSNYVSIQSRLQYARGIGAVAIGVPYNCYRIGPESTGDVLAACNLVFENFPLTRRQNKNKDGGLETDQLKSSYVYQLFSDFSRLLVGDILIQNDPVYGAGFTSVTFPTVQYNGICLSTDGVLRKPLGVRLDRNVQIYRPALEPSDADGEVGYLDTTTLAGYPLQLKCGVFSFGEVGCQASWIPSGFLAGRRSKGPIYNSVPDTMPRIYWSIFMPPIQGYLPREGDRLVSAEGDRYVITSPWQQLTGLAGYQLTVERETSWP